MALANLKRCFFPKERLGRKGFIIIFLCAILSIAVIAMLAFFLWYYYHSSSFLQFNLELEFDVLVGWFCLITGFVPLAVLFLLFNTYACFNYSPHVGFGFIVAAIIVDLLYAFYNIQCLRRCRDLGRSWLFCLYHFTIHLCCSLAKANNKGNKNLLYE